MSKVELRDNAERLAEYKKRATELVSKMSLEEKVAQMLHAAPSIDRLGVKAYNWWNEGLHGVARAGVATVFPQAIGLAATFDEDLLEQVGDAISTEARAKFNMQSSFGDRDIYKGLTFWAPNVNIFRDPRWGRGHETYGEDPYLTSRLGVRFVEGMQGHDPNYLKVAACAKHFAVHSGPEDIRHSFNAEVSEQDMRETYLPAFKALVEEAGVETVMGAYNRTNGEPCCGSKRLLTDILRGEWGFDGHVTSDCWAIQDFYQGHRVCEGPVDSVALAVNSGCDLNCGNIFGNLVEAVKNGLVEEKTIDQAVIRLFTTRMKLGLFDKADTVPYNAISYDVVDSEEMRKLNREVASKCLVLLKNEHQTLPLAKKKGMKIAVIGPNANNRRSLVGNYEGTSSRYVTILEGLQDYLGSDARIMYSEGCHLCKEKVEALGMEDDRLAEVKGVCKESDVVIACLGLDSGLEGEEGDQGNQYASGDKPSLELPGRQAEVLKAAVESGKPVILVVLSGSALNLSWAEENVPAILQGWYPGAQGGRAIAETLFGEHSPEGKLPVTFYKTSEELPEFTNYAMAGRTYRYMQNDPLYPFGYGLSYSEFAISEVKASTTEVTPAGIELTMKVSNKGSYAGRETVQVYVKAERPGTPNAQLKAIAKVELGTSVLNKEKKVTIKLPGEAFGLYREDGTFAVETGEYTVYVGTCQPTERSYQLTGQRCTEIKVTAKPQ